MFLKPYIFLSIPSTLRGSTPNISELICIFTLNEVDSAARSVEISFKVPEISFVTDISLLIPPISKVPSVAIAIPIGPANAPPTIPPRPALPIIPPITRPPTKPLTPFPNFPILPKTPIAPSDNKCGERATPAADSDLPRDCHIGCNIPPFSASLSIFFCQSVRFFARRDKRCSCTAKRRSIFSCCDFKASSFLYSATLFMDASRSAIMRFMASSFIPTSAF